jgi:hypothetical protein
MTTRQRSFTAVDEKCLFGHPGHCQYIITVREVNRPASYLSPPGQYKLVVMMALLLLALTAWLKVLAQGPYGEAKKDVPVPSSPAGCIGRDWRPTTARLLGAPHPPIYVVRLTLCAAYGRTARHVRRVFLPLVQR